MLKQLKSLLLIVLTVAVCLSVTACSLDDVNGIMDSATEKIGAMLSGIFGEKSGPTDEEKIKTVLHKFETSVNGCDYQGMIDCFEPRISKGVKSMMNLAGGLAGSLLGVKIDFNDLINVMPLFASAMVLTTEDGASIPCIKIDVHSVDVIDEYTAQAYFTMTQTIESVDKSVTAYFKMIGVDGKWYIADILENSIEPVQAENGI